jgi:hypothetical protein
MGKQHSRLPAVASVCVVAIVLGLNLKPVVAQVTVISSTPNNSPQGTTSLSVTVGGSGFENGAKATWYVTGTTDTGGVTVNSTTFVNSTQLTANITIASNATVSGYDIQVANGNGRTGVGSDLFTVNPMSVTSTLYSTAGGAALTVQGDSSSGTSVYGNTPSNCSLKPHSDCTIMDLLPNDWYLRLYSGSGRTIYLTFTALGNSPNESALDGYYLAQVATRCFDSNNNWASIPATIPPGTSNNRCSLRFNFTAANGTNYFYVMSPKYSGSGWSTVACTSGTTGVCDAWTISPTPGSLGPNPNVANLYTVAKNGSLALVGTYEMTFNITMTQP